MLAWRIDATALFFECKENGIRMWLGLRSWFVGVVLGRRYVFLENTLRLSKKDVASFGKTCSVSCGGIIRDLPIKGGLEDR